MKTIYLHIGHFKTGTSAIQKFLDDSGGALSKYGYYYPKSLRPTYNKTNHGKLSVSLVTECGGVKPGWYIDKDSFDDCIKELVNEIENIDEDKIIISTEELYRLSILKESEQEKAMTKLKSALVSYDVKVVFYVRAPFSLMKSWYNQINKGHNPVKKFVQVFYEQSVCFYSQYYTYKLWADYWGEGNVFVSQYKLKGKEHINQFLSILGMPNLCDDSDDINVRYDEKKLETIRREKFNRLSEDEIERFVVSNALIKDVGLTKMNAKLKTINEDYKRLCEHFGFDYDSEISIHDILSYGERINSHAYFPKSQTSEVKEEKTNIFNSMKSFFYRKKA